MTILRLGSLGILSLALIAVSVPAMAQSTSERLQLIEQRLSRLERIVDNNDSATDMLRRIQELQSENQALRNEVETLQFQTVQSADRERQLYLDLDQRLQALESGAAAGAGRTAGSAAPSADAGAAGRNDNAGVFAGAETGVTAGSGTSTAPASGTPAGTDMQDYSAAYDLLKQGRYPEAAAGFKAFLATYPNSELRDNAQYWLSETYYVVEDFGAALAGFQTVINNYPASRKIPDAWLKIGYCNYELKRWDDARQALGIAESRFPESTAAKLASQRLQLMSSEGH